MLGKKNIFIGLDVGSYSIKAVAIQPNKGRMTLVGYAQQRIGEQDVAVVIRQVIDQLGIKPSNLVTSVSGRSVIVRQVETPRLPESELKNHIIIDADKYIPFGIDEVVIDFQPLADEPGKQNNGNMSVQLVAVRRGFVEDHVGLLNNAGVHPKAIDVDLFALCNAYEVFGPVVNSDEKPAIALVDIGASKVCVAIVKGSRPLFTREFYLAGNEITDAIARQFAEKPDEIEELKLNPGDSLQSLLDAAMPALEDLANEIRLSFDYVEGQFDESVQSIVLSGGSSQLATIGDILGNLLGRSICVFDGLAGLDLDPKRYDIQNLEANAPSLTVALGLAVHLAGNGSLGLGGTQPNNWRSHNEVAAMIPPSTGTHHKSGTGRHSRMGTGRHNAPGTGRHNVPPQPPIQTIQAPSEPLLATPPLAPPPAAAPLDFPIGNTPAPENFAPPVMHIPVAEPSGVAAILPPESAADNLDQMFGTDDDENQVSDYGHQSSMLVILDDDDDNTGSMPLPPASNKDDNGLPPLDPP